ncbi:hypothetical protein Tco_1168882 [Tanacetum coccineum]
MPASDNGKFLDDEEWCFKKISPLVEEIMDDMSWYTDEMMEQAEKIADDLRDIAYYIVEKVVKKYTDDE